MIKQTPLRLTIALSLLLAGCSHLCCPTLCLTKGCPPPTPKHNIMFVTSLAVPPGSLGGLAGADAFCQSFAPGGANAAGTLLPAGTTYKAWLSTSTADARSRMVSPGGQQARGWVRPDGKPFLDQLADVADRVLYPPRITQTGQDIGADQKAVTNTNYYGDWPQTDSCTEFSSTSGTTGGGDPSAGAGGWTNWGPVSCAAPARIYCFGVDYATPLVITPATGRLAFITRANFVPGSVINGRSGRDAADELCRSEAAAASLPGTYLALIATSTQSAAGRFNAAGAPWVRVDGIPLVENAPDLFDLTKLLQAPLIVTADKFVFQSYMTFTGAPTPQSTSNPNTCTDWTSPSGPVDHGVSGQTGATRWLYSPSTYNDPTCSASAAHVYCLQQ